MSNHKEITVHINNMAYTFTLDEEMQEEFKNNFDLTKNNDTKVLIKAYITALQHNKELKRRLEEELLEISNKLIGY
ncbi:hypothetical protein AAX26_01901 [Aliarcobacter thereius]|uniref:Uncharacterized protein n=2 Tax=Aliarcobacter thereius TaxID=544718 RepID=A0A1C0B5U4_9BACT|nr:hypothetical protein [Aliarcobacter thereius]OCL85475.1 hypothetical protein AAX26_01901 [Aliarcobacter thereius]OCL90414.1 hypothetical protein AAX25_01505 [Aliarcobacter thereius]OCL95831.1 hypothetical protein AA347_01313 [Aliarcobacter thereius LMG 24486]OCL98400.1 hypothetical protein AAX29_01639 [Aliarcobacter thereius]QBF16195.1 hypothetical protein ATH_1138 [Aliarcobacter thereius LMG 24486]